MARRRKSPASIVIGTEEGSDPADLDLLKRFGATGDPKYRNELVGRHLERLFRRCLQLTHNVPRAEDLAHDSLVIALDRLDQCAEHFGGWLYTIAWNTWLNQKQRAGREQLHWEVGDSVAEDPNPEEITVQKERRRQLVAAIQDLPERQRICIKLSFLNDLQPAEIALETGWPIAEVYRLLENGKKTLRRRLGQAHESSSEQSGT